MKRFISALLVVVLLAAVIAVPASAEEPEPPVRPQHFEAELYPGQSIEVMKEVDVPEVPPIVDVVFAMDLTGSMGGELENVKDHITDIINAIAALPGVDVQAGLVSHVDYPGRFTSCGYTGTYGATGEWPFKVEKAVTSDFAAVDAAAQAMVRKGGGDGPESYTRVLWESAQDDSGIGYRPGAFKILVFFLDAVPHDCDIKEGVPGTSGTLSYGKDLGRNGALDSYLPAGDDIDLQDHALADMVAKNVRLITMFSGSTTYKTYWDHWSGLTGGSAYQLDSNGNPPAGLDLPTVIVNEIQDAAAQPVTVTPVPAPGCPFILTFAPPSVGPVVGPTTVNFLETITVPETVAPGFYCCKVEFFADGARIAVQDFCITVKEKTVKVPVDIKPTSCPNPLNVKSGGVLPVAILGTADLDVTQIDVSTVTLMGVSPIRSDIEDVAAPYEGGIGDPPDREDCTTAGPDGNDDLTLKFDKEAIVDALGPVSDGDVLVLKLKGKLLDGTDIVGKDVVWIKKKGK